MLVGEKYTVKPSSVRFDQEMVEFWRMRTLAQMSQREMAMMLVELVNLKYKLVVNETTGEVKEE